MTLLANSYCVHTLSIERRSQSKYWNQGGTSWPMISPRYSSPPLPALASLIMDDHSHLSRVLITHMITHMMMITHISPGFSFLKSSSVLLWLGPASQSRLTWNNQNIIWNNQNIIWNNQNIIWNNQAGEFVSHQQICSTLHPKDILSTVHKNAVITYSQLAKKQNYDHEQNKCWERRLCSPMESGLALFQGRGKLLVLWHLCSQS